MACGNCGHDNKHPLGRCATYTTEGGWCQCEAWVPGESAAPSLRFAGRAQVRKLLSDTQAFRDKSVSDAAAKARKV
jgi:hypothetical protein